MTPHRTVAPLFLRLIIGPGFMAHGWVKLSRGAGGFEKLLRAEGVPLPHPNAIVAPYVELVGGVAILIGAYVIIAAIPLLLTMLIAMIFVQGHYGFSSVNTIGLGPNGPVFGPPGYEINLLYIAGLMSLMTTGAGAISVDAWRQTNSKSIKNDHNTRST